ncbi:trehalase-like domain-containing protein [Microbacterium sp.]|uniref:trehalase-like domain-containing protein n=1 Tax=Microbacterium sp. TaxID=51671 RepID=UPI0039E21EB7
MSPVPTESAPIESYAPIGDGRTVALIGLDGDVDWLPLPEVTSPPVFARILDQDTGGLLRLRPVGEFRSDRRYLPGTNVLETTFTTAQGRVRVTDALVSGVAGRLPWAEFARRIDALTADLAAGPLMYRYSGADREEKTFVACAFWRVHALACVGRVEEATALMEPLIAHANDVGVYAEMIDADDGSAWGNVPQALSHLAFLSAALTLRDLTLDPPVGKEGAPTTS